VWYIIITNNILNMANHDFLYENFL